MIILISVKYNADFTISHIDRKRTKVRKLPKKEEKELQCFIPVSWNNKVPGIYIRLNNFEGNIKIDLISDNTPSTA